MSRMRTVAQSPQVVEKGWPAAKLRCVAVSATMRNVDDIAEWIGAGVGHTHTHTFNLTSPFAASLAGTSHLFVQRELPASASSHPRVGL